MIDERVQARNPIVQESVQHNARILQNTRSLTSSLTGICAGTLSLESGRGFLFFFAAHAFVSALLYVLLAKREPERYFQTPWAEVLGVGGAGADVVGNVMGFVLCWVLMYNLVGTA